VIIHHNDWRGVRCTRRKLQQVKLRSSIHHQRETNFEGIGTVYAFWMRKAAVLILQRTEVSLKVFLICELVIPNDGDKSEFLFIDHHLKFWGTIWFITPLNFRYPKRYCFGPNGGIQSLMDSLPETRIFLRSAILSNGKVKHFMEPMWARIMVSHPQTTRK